LMLKNLLEFIQSIKEITKSLIVSSLTFSKTTSIDSIIDVRVDPSVGFFHLIF
jgi:hypothetical protein